MDIKTPQVKNTQATVATDTTATRTPAKVTEEGKSFVDEMALLPNLDVENKIETKNIPEKTTLPKNEKQESNEFDFVSTPKNFSNNILTTNDKQVIQKNAEKELVEEIVLMNKHEVKNEKTELKTAQVSVSNKTDNLIEAEKEELTPEIVNNKEITQTDKIVLNVIPEPEKEIQLQNTVTNETKKFEPLNVTPIEIEPSETKNKILPVEKTEIKQNNVKDVAAQPNIDKKEITIQPKTESIDKKEVAIQPKVEIMDKKEITVQPKVEAVIEKDVQAKPELVEKISEPIFNKNIKLNKKAEPVINSKKEPIIASDSNKIDNLKNIIKDIEVEAVADKPVKMEEMKVIRFEPIISPVAELDKTLTTSKTSDIVKFLDANLTTNNSAKTTKATASKASEKTSEKTIKMTEADAKFFNNLIETNQQVIEGTKTAEPTSIRDIEESPSVQVSKTLLNALKESQENNKSFRVDFDKDLSVILRVTKDGKISAEFLPGDKAVEQYLKANLPQLQQQFKNEGLDYENLSYRQHKKGDEDKQKQSNRENKKENGYE